METRKIAVLATGGTIASTPADSGRRKAGVLTGDALLVSLGLEGQGEVLVDSVLSKPSPAMTRADLLQLHARCLEYLRRDDVSGIVITHGTDTLEDTAYFLQSTLPRGKPVVITGSQRAPYSPGTDAGINLSTALAAAASALLGDAGVVVAFNEDLLGASHVRKVSTFQANGFASPGYGRLGHVDSGQVFVTQRPLLPDVVPVGAALPRVDLFPASLDASPRVLQASLDGECAAVVIEAMGRGHVPPSWVGEIAALIRGGLPVVVTSSCLHGAVAAAYEFPGALYELLDCGVSCAGNLSARKARMRLMAWLSAPAAQRVPIDRLFVQP